MSQGQPSNVHRQPIDVLVIAYHFPPSEAVGSLRTQRFAEYMPQEGLRAHIITSATSTITQSDCELDEISQSMSITRIRDSSDQRIYSQCSRVLNYRVLKSFHRFIAGEIASINPRVSDNQSSWSREIIDTGIDICRRNPIKVIYSTGPPHSSHLAARAIAQRCGIPYVPDFRDPWARRSWKRKWKDALKHHLNKRRERLVIQNADRVILNNNVSRNYFLNDYPSKQPETFVSIPNGFQTETQRLIEKISSKSTDDQNKKIRTICHPGNLYGDRTPLPLLKAIAALNKQGFPVKFLQIGKCAPHCDPAPIAKQLGIEQLVESLTSMPRDQLFSKMAESDLLVVIQPNAPMQIPAKLYEIILFNKPILMIGDSPPTKQIIESAGHGESVNDHPIESIATAISELIHNQKSSVEIATERAEVKTKYEGDILSRRLCDLLKIVANNGRSNDSDFNPAYPI